MKILVVEDSGTIRALIRKELEPAGYEIMEAGSASEAIDQFEAQRPHLVTLDISLPDADGFAVCQQLRDLENDNWVSYETHNTPIIFVTGDTSEEIRSLGFAVGAADFLTKPFAPGLLRERIDQILNPDVVWNGANALVADDSAIHRKLIGGALTRMGVNVFAAADGSQAIKLASEHRDSLDLAILDYNMPKFGGDEVCRFLRGKLGLKEIPVTVISAQGDREAMLRLFAAGATDYLQKPFTIEELAARTRVHLKLASATRALTDWKAEMERHLEFARDVQRAAMGGSVSLQHVRVGVLYEPLSTVSGDTYELSVGAKGELGVFLGDATGHGIDAALMTMMLHAGLAGLPAHLLPQEVLERLHGLLLSRSGEKFVTALKLTLSPEGKLTVASAGHSPPVLLRANGTAEPCRVAGSTPLGLIPGPLGTEAAHYQLQPGDRVLLYTDGLTELNAQSDSAEVREWIIKRLLHNKEPDPSAALHALKTELLSSTGEPLEDDVTALLIRYVGPT